MTLLTRPSSPNAHRAYVSTLAAFALLPLLAGCQSQAAPTGAPAADDATPSGAVRVATAEQRLWPRSVRVQGMLIADEEAIIGAKVAGRVEKIAVDRGSPVKAGDALAELELVDFDLRVKQAEATVESVRSKLGLRPGDPDSKLDPLRAPPVLQELAMRDEALAQLERLKTLARQTAATQEQVQQQEAALKVAKARYDTAVNGVHEQLAVLGLRRTELALAQQQRTEARIIAPFEGIVQEKRVGPGSYLMVGQPVVKLVRINPLRFEATVPERHVRLVSQGDPIVIHLAGAAKPLQAKIDRISPALDRQSLSLTIEADVANPGNRLRAGHFAEADLIIEREAKAIAVPKSAVYEFAGVEKVWLVEGERAREQRVQTGRREGDFVEIVGGLKPGSRVIADATQGRAGVIQSAP